MNIEKQRIAIAEACGRVQRPTQTAALAKYSATLLLAARERKDGDK